MRVGGASRHCRLFPKVNGLVVPGVVNCLAPISTWSLRHDNTEANAVYILDPVKREAWPPTSEHQTQGHEKVQANDVVGPK